MSARRLHAVAGDDLRVAAMRPLPTGRVRGVNGRVTSALGDMSQVNQEIWNAYRADLWDKSLNTVSGYKVTIRQLDWFTAGAPLDELAKDTLTAYLADVRAKHSMSTAANRYRQLSAFYKWAEKNGVVPVSPMRLIDPPSAPFREVDVPPTGDVRAVIKAAAADTSWQGRRDHAMLRLFCEAGSPRVTEMANLTVGKVDTRFQKVRIIGKGDKERTIPYGARTAKALFFWQRARTRLPAGHVEVMFFGQHPRHSGDGYGVLTRAAIWTMLQRRCGEAGVPAIHPHQLRHWAAAAFFAAGGTERDAMELFGWSRDTMCKRYAAAVTKMQAIEAAQRFAVADTL